MLPKYFISSKTSLIFFFTVINVACLMHIHRNLKTNIKSKKNQSKSIKACPEYCIFLPKQAFQYINYCFYKCLKFTTRQFLILIL